MEKSFQIRGKERFKFVKWDRVLSAAVVEIGVDSVGDDEELLILWHRIAVHHLGVGVLAEIAGMCFFAVHDENGGADLVRVGEDWLVQERDAASGGPAIVGIQRACVVAAVGLVIIVVILDEKWRIFRQRIDHAASANVAAIL